MTEGKRKNDVVFYGAAPLPAHLPAAVGIVVIEINGGRDGEAWASRRRSCYLSRLGFLLNH